MFAVLGLDNVRFTFKCAPEVFTELIEREDIDPSPYLGRYKWVILHRLDALRNDELKDLIRQSYEMVAAKAPKKISKQEDQQDGREKAEAAAFAHEITKESEIGSHLFRQSPADLTLLALLG